MTRALPGITPDMTMLTVIIIIKKLSLPAALLGVKAFSQKNSYQIALHRPKIISPLKTDLFPSLSLKHSDVDSSGGVQWLWCYTKQSLVQFFLPYTWDVALILII